MDSTVCLRKLKETATSRQNLLLYNVTLGTHIEEWTYIKLEESEVKERTAREYGSLASFACDDSS